LLQAAAQGSWYSHCSWQRTSSLGVISFYELAAQEGVSSHKQLLWLILTKNSLVSGNKNAHEYTYPYNENHYSRQFHFPDTTVNQLTQGVWIIKAGLQYGWVAKTYMCSCLNYPNSLRPQIPVTSNRVRVCVNYDKLHFQQQQKKQTPAMTSGGRGGSS